MTWIDKMRDASTHQKIELARISWAEIIAVIVAAEQLRENWTGKSDLFMALMALENKVENDDS